MACLQNVFSSPFKSEKRKLIFSLLFLFPFLLLEGRVETSPLSLCVFTVQSRHKKLTNNEAERNIGFPRNKSIIVINFLQKVLIKEILWIFLCGVLIKKAENCWKFYIDLYLVKYTWNDVGSFRRINKGY